jgi:hypothetical protein
VKKKINQEIYSMAVQAGFYSSLVGVLFSQEVDGEMIRVHEEVDKFAQLLIRACADQCRDDDAAFDILKHFGLEQ